MRRRECINKLHIHTHLVVRFLHAALENVQYPELLRDLGKILGRASKFLRRRARDDFQIGDLGKPREDFILHAFREVPHCRDRH